MIKRFRLYKGKFLKESIDGRVITSEIQTKCFFYDNEEHIVIIRRPNLLNWMFSISLPHVNLNGDYEEVSSIKEYIKRNN